jgi:hypothetical protein
MSLADLVTDVRAYIQRIVTDDDSTTRANLRHSLKAVWMTSMVMEVGGKQITGQE